MMTRFTYTPVPEPSTWALLALGLALAILLRAKRRFLGRKEGRIEVSTIAILISWASVCSASAAYVESSPFQNFRTPAPFLLSRAEVRDIRLQEALSGGIFSGASHGAPLLITEISYSAPSWAGRVPIDVTLPNIEIRLSTTTKEPRGLSYIWGENIGADETVVFSGPLHFYETGLELYDIRIPTKPFIYDPTAGNLLIDIFNYAPISDFVRPDWVLNATYPLPPSVGVLSGNVDSISGSLGGASLVTRFTYTPVPEPSTWALLALGVAGLMMARWRHRSHGASVPRGSRRPTGVGSQKSNRIDGEALSWIEARAWQDPCA